MVTIFKSKKSASFFNNWSKTYFYLTYTEQHWLCFENFV